MPNIPRVASDKDLPKKVTVAIVGGGIIGVCTALELAERGVDVALFEKGEIAAEQSSRNWGWCRQMGRDPREIPLMKVSLNLWRNMHQRAGEGARFHPCGIIYFSDTPETQSGREAWHEKNARQFGLDTELIAGARVAELLPGSIKPFAGGIYTPSDGRAEPFTAVPAMAEAARRRGVKLFTQCAVRGFETAGGKISGVITEKGRVDCQAVVVAGGAWTRRFLHNMDVPFKQLTVVNSVMRTNPLEIGHRRTASGSHFSFRKRLDGGYTITHNAYSVAEITPDSFELFFDFLPALKSDWHGLKLKFGAPFFEALNMKRKWRMDEVTAFERHRILDPKPVDWILDVAVTDLKSWFPAFRDMTIAERWAGYIDTTPDVVPVLSSVGKQPGLFIASGMSGHGFGIGPGAGKLMAELITGDSPCVDPAPFRYSRQIDGTKPVPLSGP